MAQKRQASGDQVEWGGSLTDEDLILLEDGEIVEEEEEQKKEIERRKNVFMLFPYCVHYRLGPTGYCPKRSDDNEPTFDLFCCKKTKIYPHTTKAIPLGIQFLDLRRPAWGEILTRVGLSTIHSLDVVPGSIIRPNSRKFLAVSIRNHSNKVYTFAQGEPIAKLKMNPNPWCTLIKEETDS